MMALFQAIQEVVIAKSQHLQIFGSIKGNDTITIIRKNNDGTDTIELTTGDLNDVIKSG